MSISYKEPLTSEAQEKLTEIFGQPVAQDDQTALLDRVERLLDLTRMKELTNAAKQPITVAIHGTGERKTVAGTEYEVTPQGWVKVGDDNQTPS